MNNQRNQTALARLKTEGDLVDAAVAAIERLRVQTLWNRHPASFYHSATQEIISLFRQGFMHYLPEVELLPAISLLWDVDGDAVIKYNESTNSQHLIPFDEWHLDHNNMKWKIVFQIAIVDEIVDKADYIGVKSRMKYVIDPFWEDLIVLRAVKELSRNPLMTPTLAAENAAQVARKAIAARLKNEKDLHVAVMLYVPNFDDPNSAFLYYPWYDCRSPRDQFDLEFFTSHSQDSDSIWKYALVHALALYPETERSTLLSEMDLSRIETFVHDSTKNYCSSLDKKPDTIWSSLFTHPNAFLERQLLYQPIAELAEKFELNSPEQREVESLLQLLQTRFFKENPPCNCTSPVCRQIKGEGIAGRVGVQYVSEFVKKMAAQDRLSWNKRNSNESYFLMGILEGLFGLQGESSGIVVPLFGKGQFLGALIAYRSKEVGGFESSDVELCESVADEVGRMIQEAKDHTFFEILSWLWNDILREAYKRNSSEAITDWLNKAYEELYIEVFKKIVPFVMNCKPDEPLKVFRAEPPKQVIIEEEENNYIAIKIPPLSLRVEKSKAAEKKSKWWQIRALVEEPKVIRDEHLWELEILFNYCFSMTGAILPANTSKPRKRRKLKYK